MTSDEKKRLGDIEAKVKSYKAPGSRMRFLLNLIRRQQGEIERLREALTDSIEVCRSAHSIAARKGEQTFWDSFTRRLKKTIDIQYKALAEHGEKEGE